MQCAHSNIDYKVENRVLTWIFFFLVRNLQENIYFYPKNIPEDFLSNKIYINIYCKGHPSNFFLIGYPLVLCGNYIVLVRADERYSQRNLNNYCHS